MLVQVATWVFQDFVAPMYVCNGDLSLMGERQERKIKWNGGEIFSVLNEILRFFKDVKKEKEKREKNIIILLKGKKCYK